MPKNMKKRSNVSAEPGPVDAFPRVFVVPSGAAPDSAARASWKCEVLRWLAIWKNHETSIELANIGNMSEMYRYGRFAKILPS